ncbi:MAG: DUF3313 domain-containing protein [Gammaproteobacteria bacterium]|nr:DUF3313 domain-containing protein [Gammaproteobacteria bacterium]MDH4310229.1 DUF3313 domain-containing protein [Gammaproteobacteria bacterium]MDH5273969.1 DUF3313 domain-containing protein [Gammaproteobacteria bacterium]
MDGIQRSVLRVGCAALLGGCAVNVAQPPATWDGLDYRPGQESGALYVRPGAQSMAYRTVMVDPLAVAIPEHWYPVGGTSEHLGTGPRKLSSSELQHIKDTLAGRFRYLFVAELTDGGYRVVERPGDDTVRVSPGLADVYMNTPERSLTARRRADSMTLVMDVRDATTGELLARLVDRQKGVMGALQFPNTVANSVDFRRAVEAWAQRLRAGLDEMSKQSP